MLLSPLVYSVIAEPFAIKAAISVGVLLPIGFLMGMPMPTGIRLVKSIIPNYVPWMWAINGGFSVLGAVFTVIISILYGASYALSVGIASYVVAFGLALIWKRDRIELIAQKTK
jgi:hypothetical protein